MKYFIIVLFSLSSILISCKQLQNKKQEEATLSKLNKLVEGSVFNLYSFGLENSEIIGTAVVIDETGIAITQYDILDSPHVIVAINYKGEKFGINEIINFNKELNYLVIRLGASEKKFNFIEIEKNSSNTETQCFSILKTNDSIKSISHGIIRGFNKDNSIIYSDISKEEIRNNLPLFNNKCRIVGINTAISKDGKFNASLNSKSILLDTINDNSKEILDRFESMDLADFDAKEYVKNYYDLKQGNHLDKLSNLFSTNVKRYYGTYNPSLNNVIKEKEQIPDFNTELNRIDYDEIKVSKVVSGNYLIEFRIVYIVNSVYAYQATEMPVKINMLVNPQFKIVGIYENASWLN